MGIKETISLEENSPSDTNGAVRLTKSSSVASGFCNTHSEITVYLVLPLVGSNFLPNAMVTTS